ncbi:hypothetical protein AC578_10919 [Pseudocercospora eumusae]|uniref:NAD-dependent epimerase/dehydratase domain-containing protein n=1 Tax=Pseudocercospora eumusae TaxID=321146 RepID=A0A139GVJ1_9PEZI|nr:hypothetical protein AC578_10919 [Pseudocercospora eumusae]
MAKNILVAGAAGYIGGSVLTHLAAGQVDSIHKDNLFAVVRSTAQVEAIRKLGVNVIQLDLEDARAVMQTVTKNNIDIIINAAVSFNPDMASSLIKALGQRQRESGQQTYYIHSSVTAVFTAEAQWPYGQIKDSDPDIFQKDKQACNTQGYSPVRITNVVVAELSKELGVKSYNIALPTVHGRGFGECRKTSVKIPAYLRLFLKERTVYRYEKEASETAAHISDIVDLYALLVQKILSGDSAPEGENGYYFAFSHYAPSWKTNDELARLLLKKGLVDSAEVKTFASDEEAGEKMGIPAAVIGTMLSNSGKNMIAENPYKIGWKPKWDEQRYLESLEKEIDDALELEDVKPTLFQSLANPK